MVKQIMEIYIKIRIKTAEMKQKNDTNCYYCGNSNSYKTTTSSYNLNNTYNEAEEDAYESDDDVDKIGMM